MEDEETTFGVKPDRLDRLVFEVMAEPEDPQEASPTASLDMLMEKVGSWIGRYKLLEVLGEGGMGIVYLAEQVEPITRQVALKVIKPGMDSKRVTTRFEAERQALALLDHPNIAHVYDAGTTEAGRPYFVMECVEGPPITKYCDEHKLPIEQRLRLFQQVCNAVQHAHQKGIIHRDLKPSNVLVATDGDKATPKIIDFGVAKAIGHSLTEDTLFTEDTHLLGTPEYMSPEQAEMANEDIDTRSDIYSLGVLLYVLLTGVLPFDSDTLRTGGIEHIRQVIRETDPKTPSTKLIKLGDEAKKVAENRCTQVASLAKRLHSELEWIPLKAMQKERAERYRSASELADDIESYLKGAPLIAGPPGAVYRFRKFVRRNAMLSAAVLAVAVTLLLGLVATTAMYLRAERAYDREARAHAEAQAITDFLTEDVLRSAQQIRGRVATVIDIIEAAAANLEGDTFNDQPLVEASVRQRLAAVYDMLGYYRQSILHKARQYEILRQCGQDSHVAKNYLAIAYRRSGEYEQAESLFKELIPDLRETSILWRPSQCNLANVYYGQGRYHEAERLLLDATNESLEDQARRGKSLRDWYAAELAQIYRGQGRYVEAEQEFIRAIKVDKKDKAWGKLPAMSGLGRLYVDQVRYQEAEELFTRAIEESQLELPGKDHPVTLRAISGLAVLRTKQRDFVEAESLFKQALEGRKEKLGEDHPETLETINDFGILRREQQRCDEAESLLCQAVDGRQRKLGPDHPACFESMHELGILYLRQARYEDAERLLLEAFHGRETKLGPEHPHTIDSLKQLATLYESWSNPDEAAKWRAKLPRVEDAEEQR